MKKILTLLTIVSFMFSSLIFAATNEASPYYSSSHPKQTNTLQQQSAYPATNITIYNRSADIVYVSVPGTPIYDVVYPNNNDHVYNDYYAGMTRVILKDPYQANFFDGYICRYGIINVSGYPGSYNVYVDSNNC